MLSLSELQEKWIETKDDKDLLRLEHGLVFLAENLIKKELSRIGAIYTTDKIEMAADYSAKRLIRCMCKKLNAGVDPRIKYFPARLRFDCLYILYSKEFYFISDDTVEIEDNRPLIVEKEETESPYEAFEFLAESRNGKLVILALFASKSFKQAVLIMSKYMSRQWIYNNAKRLKSVWDHLQ